MSKQPDPVPDRPRKSDPRRDSLTDGHLRRSRRILKLLNDHAAHCTPCSAHEPSRMCSEGRGLWDRYRLSMDKAHGFIHGMRRSGKR